MRSRRLAVIASMAVLVAMMLLSVPAALAQGPGENSVTGTGATADGFFTNILVDAHSDSSGNVSGTVSFTVPVGVVSGPVTCLAIDGNRALIGFNDVTQGIGGNTVAIVDNGPSGTPPDTFLAAPLATDCVDPPAFNVGGPLGSGDFVVSEIPPLTSKDQCEHGGWRNFTDDQGQPFKNQGACIKFVHDL
jgi:hypothetical protein